jgi:hypothetical protein
MTRAARIIWSDNNWDFPQGNADYGVPVNDVNPPYKYGLEEFLFNQQLLDLNLGYLDCYRSNNIQGVENVVIFTIDPAGQRVVVGIMHEVEQLQNHETIDIWNQMNDANYIEQTVAPAFSWIETANAAAGTNVFLQCNYGLNENFLPQVQGVQPNGFFVNLRYRKIEIFHVGDERRLNLSQFYPGINQRWNRLGKLYHVENVPEVIEILNDLFI